MNILYERNSLLFLKISFYVYAGNTTLIFCRKKEKIIPAKETNKLDTKPNFLTECLMESGDVLLSRAVASQVLSTEMSLTTVFGMGTGGPSP